MKSINISVVFNYNRVFFKLFLVLSLFVSFNIYPLKNISYSTANVEISMVDVYFGDRYVTSQLAEIRADYIKFYNLNSLIEKIPNIKDKDKIKKALTGKLDSNKDKLCGAKKTNNCGFLSPEIAAVIFNNIKFRADVFVNPDNIKLSKIAKLKYLPKPEEKLTSIFVLGSLVFLSMKIKK